MKANLDVLELIFARLDESDLVSTALVSRAFLAGTVPALYANIEYTTRHAKRAHQIISPFTTLVAHDHLAVHVKRVAIYAAPVFPTSSHQPSPSFLKDLAQALHASPNLRSFVCTPKIVPPLLPHLVDKPRLRHLRVCASLGPRQMSVLKDCTGLYSLSLDSPSWNVIDALPTWSASMQKTLAHLTLSLSQDIDTTVLNATLAQLPRLLGLHVIGCPRVTHVTVLRALSHTPSLRELSFSIFPSQETTLPPLNFSIPPLTHLSIDIRASYIGLKSLLASLIACFSPRDALAICGGWIGEIKSTSEAASAQQGGNTPGAAGGGSAMTQNAPGHAALHGPTNAHHQGNNHVNDPPLLSPPDFYHGVPYPNQNPGMYPLLPGQSVVFEFPFLFHPNHPGGNNGDGDDPPHPGPANPPNLHNPNLDFPSLISSFPPTLSILHLPQLSPAGLREVVERCEGLQVLGFAMGNAFASPALVKASRMTSGIRAEVCVLSDILAHARELRELIIETSGTEGSPNGTVASSDTRAGESHSTPFIGTTLLTSTAVRTLMQESPYLRRIVGEGRVWESTTPTPSSPVPFPRCLNIELKLSRARYGPGMGNNHNGPGFHGNGNGCGQLEAGNEHWFWLRGSESGSQVGL